MHTEGNPLTQAMSEEYTERTYSPEVYEALRLAREGDQLLAQGQTGEAKERYKQALRRDPLNSWCREQLAKIYVQRDDWAEAEQLWREAVEELPSEAWLHFAKMAELCESAGRLDDAQRLLQEAVELEPWNDLAHANLATYYERYGNLEKAKAEYRAAVEESPATPSYYLNLARVLGYMDELEEADRTLSDALREGRFFGFWEAEAKDQQRDVRQKIALKPAKIKPPVSEGRPVKGGPAIVPSLLQFFRHAPQPALAASAPRDVLVVNTAREIPMEITYGPVLNQKGEVTVGVKPDVNTLEVDIKKWKVYVDLLFLPTSPSELLGSFRITSDAGLRLKAPLPDSPELQDFLAKVKKTGQRLIHLPQKAFAFRIWWEES